MADGPILGIVLAAGLSRRLGRPKQLLLLNGDPLVSRVVRLCNDSMLDGAVVVGGHVADQVQSAIADLPHHWVMNADYASGQASSLVAGVRSAETLGADAVVVLLADQPGIPVRAINLLVDQRRRSGAGIAMTSYGPTRSHPILFGREFFGELLQIDGDQGGREVIQRHKSELVLVPSGLETVPLDVDTDEDYLRLTSS